MASEITQSHMGMLNVEYCGCDMQSKLKSNKNIEKKI